MTQVKKHKGFANFFAKFFNQVLFLKKNVDSQTSNQSE